MLYSSIMFMQSLITCKVVLLVTLAVWVSLEYCGSSSLDFSCAKVMANIGDGARGGGNGPARGVFETEGDEGKYIVYLQEQLALANEKSEKTDKFMEEILHRFDRMQLANTRPTEPVLDFTPRKVGQPPNLTPQVATEAHLPHGDLSLPRPWGRGELLQGASLSSTNAPAEVLGAPLTQVLADLTDAINPVPKDYKKGILLRPEYYVHHKLQCKPLKSIDHSKMTCKDLMFGMSQVLQYIVGEGGDIRGYINHMAFVTRQAQLDCFSDSALVSYDRDVIDRVIRGDLSSFVAGDPISVACNFHAGNIQQTKRDQSKRGRGGFFKPRVNRLDTADSADRDQTPFPQDLCYNFNYRKCYSAACQKLHLCRICRGKHRGLGCQERA